MANHPSALKRARQNEKRRKRNAAVKTRIRNLIKQVRKAIEAGKFQEAHAALREAVPKIHKAAAKGVLHKNTAARYISRLSKKVSLLEKEAS